MPTMREADVFISYSSHDKTWARDELLHRIEQAGLKAFIDFRDFTRGAPSIKEMERGVLIRAAFPTPKGRGLQPARSTGHAGAVIRARLP